jgi:transposase
MAGRMEAEDFRRRAAHIRRPLLRFAEDVAQRALARGTPTHSEIASGRLAAGLLSGVWCPDEKTRALRRLVARRAQLMRQRSRAKNEIAVALQRNLLERPEVDDVAGTKGTQQGRAEIDAYHTTRRPKSSRRR